MRVWVVTKTGTWVVKKKGLRRTMPTTPHVHAVEHWPKTEDSTGYGVCECGATVRVEHGNIVGPWHACELCSTEAVNTQH